MPVFRGARKPRHLHAQDEPHVIEADLRDQPCESLPALGRACRLAQVFVDDKDAPLRPAQGDGAVGQAILEVGGLAMVHHLLDGRLADIDHRQPLQVPPKYLFGARHRRRLRRTIHYHHLPPVKPYCCSFVPPSGVSGVCSAAPPDACGSAAVAPPMSVGTLCLEAGGNCSVRHAARSCRSAFREVLSLTASSTIPSSPASPMIGCAEGFVCTGVLWLGN